MKKIVIDMMGSDLGSPALKEGVIAFHRSHPDYSLVCVGKKEELESLSFAKIVDARDVIGMEAGALEVLRKKDSSMVVALKTFLAEKADGIISAGATGGFLSTATLTLKKINGVIRPALITAFPSIAAKEEGKYVSILDIGASNVNTPQEIAQFAYMGSLYAEAVYGIKKPVVKMLSNGIEEGKGSPEGKEAYNLMKNDPKINFGGNVEASAVLNGTSDVVVTDGFTGNVLLKSTEGTAKAIGNLLKKGFKKNLLTKIGYLFAKDGIKVLKKHLDARKVGGALLIGVNGVAVKAHGNSDGLAFRNALEVVHRLIEGGVVEKIREGFKE